MATTRNVIDIPRGDSVSSSKVTCSESDFEVIRNEAPHDDFENAEDTKLVNLAPFDLLIDYILTTSSGNC